LNEDVKRDTHGMILMKQDSGASDNVVKTFFDSFSLLESFRILLESRVVYEHTK